MSGKNPVQSKSPKGTSETKTRTSRHVTDLRRPTPESQRDWLRWIVVVGAIVVIVLIVALAMRGAHTSTVTVHQTKPSSPKVTAASVDTFCSQHQVEYNPNNPYQDVVSGGLPGSTPQQVVDNFKADGKTDPYVTQSAAESLVSQDANTFKDEPDIQQAVNAVGIHAFDIDNIVSGSCYTPFGYEVYSALVNDIFIPSNEKSITFTTAPVNGANAMVTKQGGNTTWQTGAVGGNASQRKAAKVILKDGASDTIMTRCGNIVMPAPPTSPPTPTSTPCPTCTGFQADGGPAKQTQLSTQKPTVGYTPGSAEAVTAAQPVTTLPVTTSQGANTGSTSTTGAPHDTNTVPAGNTQPTNAGTSNPQNTQATGQTAPAGDPGAPQ